MKKFTVDSVLSVSAIMDDFIKHLESFKLTNYSGESHSRKCFAYFDKGVLLSSMNHIDHKCDIKILSDKTSKLIRGCNNPKAYYSELPKPEKGILVKIWENGKLDPGPWEPTVRSVIQNAINKLEEKMIEREKIIEQEELNEIERIKKIKEDLIEEWS